MEHLGKLIPLVYSDLVQFQVAYPEIYSSKFPSMDADAFKGNNELPPQRTRPANGQSTMLARIRSLRLAWWFIRV